MMLKKIAKTLDEMAKNEDLMAGIFAAGEMDGEEQDNDYNDDQMPQ